MVPELLAGHEQNVEWVSGPAHAKDNQLRVATFGSSPSSHRSYVLASTSVTGTTFVYYRRVSGSAVRCKGEGDPVAWADDGPTACEGDFAGEW